MPAEIELHPQFNVEGGAGPSVDESLLQPYSVDILKQDAAQRLENRLPFFSLLSIKKAPESTDQRGTGTRTLYHDDDYRLNVSLTRLNFDGLETIEPLFISLTLYDVQARTPLSETFSVCVSDPALIGKLKGRPVCTCHVPDTIKSSSKGGSRVLLELLRMAVPLRSG